MTLQQVGQDKTDKQQSNLENRVLQNEKGIKLLVTTIKDFKEGQRDLQNDVKNGQMELQNDVKTRQQVLQDCMNQLVPCLGQ